MKEYFEEVERVAEKLITNITWENKFMYLAISILVIGIIYFIRKLITGKSMKILTMIKGICFIGYALFISDITIFSRERRTHHVFMTELLTFPMDMTNLLNFLFFVPWGGILMWMQERKPMWKGVLLTLCYSFLTSLAIEVTQYVTMLGYFEIDDLQTNALGGLCGAVLMMGVLWIAKKYSKHKDLHSVQE